MLARAGADDTAWPRWRLRPTRRLALVAALAVAVAVPLVALGGGNGWWFFEFKDVPRPVSKAVVVTEGSWSGHSWKLVAYQSQSDGRCWSVTFDESTAGAGAIGMLVPGPGAVREPASVLSCGSVVGVQPPHRASGIPTITYVEGASSAYVEGASSDGSFPSWIAGPVVRSAATVVIRWRSGEMVRVPTVSSPESLGEIGWFRPVRFYAAPLPDGVSLRDVPLSLTGVDAGGRVVACLVSFGSGGWGGVHGWSPLSDCER